MWVCTTRGLISKPHNLVFVATRHVALFVGRKRNVFHCQIDWILQSQISLFTSARKRELSEGPLILIKAIHHLSGTVTAHIRETNQLAAVKWSGQLSNGVDVQFASVLHSWEEHKFRGRRSEREEAKWLCFSQAGGHCHSVCDLICFLLSKTKHSQ